MFEQQSDRSENADLSRRTFWLGQLASSQKARGRRKACGGPPQGVVVKQRQPREGVGSPRSREATRKAATDAYRVAPAACGRSADAAVDDLLRCVDSRQDRT